MEILPDVKMRDVKIHYNLAFPLAVSRKEGVLTKYHFEDEHQEDLLTALGIPPTQESSQHTLAMQDTYKRIVCRYLGPHSQVPSKLASESFRRGLSALQLAKKGTESCLEATTTESEAQTSEAKETAEKILYKNVKKAVSNDIFMRKIRSAKLNKNFSNKFQKDNPNIPLEDWLKVLKIGQDSSLIHIPTGKTPLFGIEVFKAVLEVIDEHLSHQGEEEILEALKKENYLLFDDIGEPFKTSKIVKDHVLSCRDCTEVESIKKLTATALGTLITIPDDAIPRVLAYADRRHQGFADAYTRIKSWCDFTDFEDQVR